MANEWLEAFADYMQYRMRAYHQCPACGGAMDYLYNRVYDWIFSCMECDAKFHGETLLPIREEE
jgi:ribosomal protein L37AE/L43A